MRLERSHRAGRVLAGMAVLCLSSAAWANVYPSSVIVDSAGFDANCGTAKVSFILNEKAAGNGVNDGVVIEVVNGANQVVRTVRIPRLAKGRHSFEWDGRNDAGNSVPNGNYTFRITATDFGYTSWTQISSDALTQNKYYSPRGLSVNRNASSPNFGRVYVSNAVAGTTAGAGPRTTGDGIYVLGADLSDILGQGDTAFAGGVDWVIGTNASPWKITVAPDDTVYITDWSDGNSGVWRCNANPQPVFDVVLTNAGRQPSGLVPGVHGSVAACWVEGTGENTKLYTVDEDYPDALGTFGVGRGDILRYDIGTALNYAGAPVIQTADDTSAAGNYYNPGVILNGNMDFVRAADGSWWITQQRSVGQDSAGAPALGRWLDGATGPIWDSGGRTPDLSGSFGIIAIHDGMQLLALGTNTSQIFLVSIADPTAPTLIHTIPHAGSTIRDLDFDAAGNLYAVSNISERLRVYSPPSSVGGNTFTTLSQAVVLNKSTSNGPKITDQPDNVVVCVGDSANFSIAATVGASPTYQWKKNGVPLVTDGVNVIGATTPSLTLNNVAAADAGAAITCVVCDANGVAVSDPAILGVGVAFLEAPVSLDICANTNAVFTVNVVGKGTISYQWERAPSATGTFASVGTNSPVLTLPAVQAADSGSVVRCQVTDACGTVTSPSAVLTVRGGPTLVTLYADRTLAPGGSTFFQIDATGKGTLTYQWYKDNGSGPVALVDGPGVSGSQALRMFFNNATCSDNGARFSVEVTDQCGTVSSIVAQTPGFPALQTNGVCRLTVTGTENADPAAGSAACSNGVDDDCDGLVDCDDPDCAGDLNCGPECNTPFADWDGDGDVDMLDFADFQRCFAIAGTTISDGCECFDHNNDGQIDVDDATFFIACGSGAGVPADPACGNRPSGLGKVVINEVVYDVVNILGLEMTDLVEFIELYNRSAESVDISGWVVRNSDDDTNRAFLIPGGKGSNTTVLAPGGYYVIASANVPVPAANPPYLYVDVLTGAAGTDFLENGPDAIELLDANRDTVDTLIYDRRTAGAIAAPGEGAVWGDLNSTDIPDPLSLSRWFDGLDTDNNGRDFGMRPRTPGTNNQGTGAVISNYTVPNVDGQPPGSTVDGLMGTFRSAFVITPGDATTINDGKVLNPNVIPASPQGGRAVVVWDHVAGGGNAAVSNDVMFNAGGYDLYVYLDTSFAAWGADTGRESTSYGVMGTTDTAYVMPDPDGSFATAATGNGNTGLAWVFQKIKTASTSTCKLFLVDAKAGGDSRPSAGIWQVHATIDMSAMAPGWYRLKISYNGATGAVQASLNAQTYNFATATGLAGGFYVGYREFAGTTEDPTPVYLRPATFDTAP